MNDSIRRESTDSRVVITGMGCITPLGHDVDSTWGNLIKGESGVDFITLFDATEYKTRFAAEVKEFRPEDIFGRKDARRMDRVAQFALFAARQAIEHAHLDITDDNRDRIGVVVGTGIGGLSTMYEQFLTMQDKGPDRVSPFLVPMMLPDTSAGLIAIEFGIRGTNMAIVTACATGTNVIGEAAEMIRRGQVDVVLAGGTEAAIVPLAFAGLNVAGALSTRNDAPRNACRPFDLERDGFVMGEGAAILVLEREAHARQRGANLLAEVVGYGSTNDAYHISAPAENGAGAVLCMKQALASANLRPDDIDYINAHGTSTKLNDKSETAAIKQVFEESAYKIPVSSTKSMTGHLLGAAGALEAIICVQAICEGMIPPTINYQTPDPECDLDYVPNQARKAKVRYAMSNSFGFGGHNATIVLGAVEDGEK